MATAPSKPRRTALPLLLLSSLAACATTSESYVEEFHGYAVTRGRITEIVNLSATPQALADGAALAVKADRCSVTMEFDDGSSRVLEVVPPGVVILGSDRDYVLRPAESGVGDADGAGQGDGDSR